jgi:hypothetical protein
LDFFKKTRELDVTFERTFVKDLLHEFDTSIIDGTMLYDRIDNESVDYENGEVNIGDNMFLGDLNDGDNISISQLSEDSQNRFGMNNANLEDNILTLQTGLNNNIDNNERLSTAVSHSFMDGFSYLKTANIKEYIEQFGDGSKQVLNNLPHFKNFSKIFDKLDNMKLFNMDNKNAYNKRAKKEEKLFEFSIETEVNKHDIFDKDSKNKNIIKKEFYKNIKKKHVKTFYNYDRSM